MNKKLKAFILAPILFPVAAVVILIRHVDVATEETAKAKAKAERDGDSQKAGILGRMEIAIGLMAFIPILVLVIILYKP